MKVSEAIFEFFSKKGVDQCFAVTGGAAAHLFDSVSRLDFQIIHMHHEQACAMAADGYARVAKKPAIVLVTNGPGVSNAITGVLGAFQDSVPMIIISGQVSTPQMLQSNLGIERQFGVQELNTGPLVESIVKYFVSISETSELEKILNDSWFLATTGRPGPVWIEVPLNVQSQIVNEISSTENFPGKQEMKYAETITAIQGAKKPLLIVGSGIHASDSAQLLVDFARKLNIPVVSTWGANDLFDTNDEIYLGNFGIFGNRIPNFAVQRADLLVILGSRLSIPNTGYQSELFCPGAKKLFINIDKTEAQKSSLNNSIIIETDVKLWLQEFPAAAISMSLESTSWQENLAALSKEYGISREGYSLETGTLDSYLVIEKLSKLIAENATLVTDMGTSFTCTMQAFRNFRRTRLFTSSGTSSMGFGLPGAIGAYFADTQKPIYLIAGDGGFQMNIQELQTVIFHKIPLRILVLDSNGYLAISIMQQNLFQSNFVGSNPESGVDAPNFCKVAEAYGLDTYSVSSELELVNALKALDSVTSPILVSVKLPTSQLMRPRSQSLKRDDGTLYSMGIEHMWPYLAESEIEHIEKMLS